MKQPYNNVNRKKFLIWGTAILSSFSVLSFLFGNRKKKGETVKMLTQDGTLVEIDTTHVKKKGSKISDSGIHDWIKPSSNS